ncbi:unnamed protein product [Ceutorhynchus assimilis]|uniref:Polycystic kidney disease 2-like 1 protein n=1 Tax=Ceutorhynchus assimilis TaxID=467358 RepID=A0A9N9MRN6_9CUCU|nr:unnamed protein product [Ceutorhynchus assimilis]
METVQTAEAELLKTLPKAKKPKRKKPLWITTTIAGASLGRRELLAATFKEVIFHIISMVFLSTYIFSQVNPSEYYLTLSLKNAFNVENGLMGVVSAEQLWEYLTQDMMFGFYGFDFDETGNETEVNETGLYISKENLLLGVPRIRQVKVSNDSCEIHGYFRRLFESCYYQFGHQSENRETFGLGKPIAWTYSEQKITKSVRYWGTLTSYSGGGFYADLTSSPNTTLAILNELKENLWITRGTRAIFVDFSIYNGNLNLHCVCKLIFEFLPSGGVTPNYRFSTATLTPVRNVKHYVLKVLLYIFSAYAAYCLCEELREMFYFKCKYFLQFWNYIDLCVIFLTFLLVFGTEYNLVNIKYYVDNIRDNPTAYGNLEQPHVLYQVVNIGGAVLLFFLYMRTFKYLNFNRRMAQLNNTIRNCAKDIMGFSVMFFVAFFAYAELGYLVFGNEVDDFRSFGQSMFTLLRTILGDFDYDKIHNANWIVAPIYFLTYIMLVFFVLLNMFLAIINDTYADVKTDIAIAPKEMEMTEYIGSLYTFMKRKLGCKVKKDKDTQRPISTNIGQIRDALIKCNYDDREIAMYFTRYDIDPLKDLKREDIERFHDMFGKEDLARRRLGENVVTQSDFQKQDDKLVELENSLATLGEKLQELIQTVTGIRDQQARPVRL